MKIQINGKDCFELSELQKKVIMNDIHEDEFESDMKRRLEYILQRKYEQCFERLKAEWMPVLEKSMDAVPTDPNKLAEVIFSHLDYKSRKYREEQD